jgi:hypothetical protein
MNILQILKQQTKYRELEQGEIVRQYDEYLVKVPATWNTVESSQWLPVIYWDVEVKIAERYRRPNNVTKTVYAVTVRFDTVKEASELLVKYPESIMDSYEVSV